jgi:hypothetical protein
MLKLLLERYKSPSMDQILAELIQAGETLCSYICHIPVNTTPFQRVESVV